MKCKDFEQEIYLYSELSETEKIRVDAHIQECDACKELFQLVSSARVSIEQASLKKPELTNHARLTSNIMQAVADQQKQSTLWINSLFLKYTMVAASLALIIVFGVEQLSHIDNLSKTMPGAKTVTLNSAVSMKGAFERKQNPAPKPSLYACVKSGGCENIFIERFKKKSL